MFPFWDNEFAGKLDFCDLSVKCGHFLQVYYLGKETSAFAENFSIYYRPRDLPMDKTSGRNFVIRFFPRCLAIGLKSSKTVIALEGKPISAYPFRLFLLSLGPTYGQDITSKAISKLMTLPRKSLIEEFLCVSIQAIENNIKVFYKAPNWLSIPAFLQ